MFILFSLYLWIPLIRFSFKFTDSDGGVAAEFVQMLQDLNAKNSEHELSIEKFLTKSEEAFFGKVRKQKLDDAASVRSSYRDSMWGTPAVSMYSTPACMNFFLFGTSELLNTASSAEHACVLSARV